MRAINNKRCQACAGRAVWADLSGAVGQAVFRSLLGWMSGSLGLLVLGMYSFSDALTKAFTLFSVKIAQRPPSKTFPFGVGKILFVSSLAIGLALVSSGIFVGLRSFTDVDGVSTVPGLMAFVGTIVSGGFGVLMYKYLSCVGNKNNNTAIQSAAMENRIDAISSAVVLGGIVLANVGFPEADHFAAFTVSLLVVWMGAKITWEAVKGLMDISVPQDVLADIARTSRLTPKIDDVELVRGRSLGEYWEIYIHVAIDETLTIADNREIVGTLRARIQKEFPKVQHVWIVTNPSRKSAEDEKDYWSEQFFSMPHDEAPEEELLPADNGQPTKAEIGA